MNYKLEIKTLTCTTHATPHPTDHLTGLPRIRVANTMLTPKTKPRGIWRMSFKTTKCSSSVESQKGLESSRPPGGRVARSRPSDHPEQPSASDGGGNEKVSRGSGEGCSTHLECWSKSPQSQDQVRVARLEVYVESAVRGSRAARQLVEDWSTCSSSQPATSGRACRAPLNCQIPTENSWLRAAARHYGAAPRGIWAAMSPSQD